MREPDFCVGGRENPYLKRWYITPWSGLYRDKIWGELKWWQKTIRTLPNIYLHQFLRDDDDRAFHDHPWASCSIILMGAYLEHTNEGILPRIVGGIYFRKAESAHRIELYGFPKIPVWTLFITGFKIRDWGFHCPKGFVPWQVFCDDKDSGKIGKGCE